MQTINISTEVQAREATALADFYRNRSLIASQAASDLAEELRQEKEGRAAVDRELTARNAEIELLTKPSATADNDSALADMLRKFVATGARNDAAVSRLMADAALVIARDAE